MTIFSFLIASEFLSMLKEKRNEIIANQLMEMSVNIVIMIKAGRSLRNIIKNSVSWTKPPLKKYVKNLADELDTGLTFDLAFDNFSARCATPEAMLIVTALKINNKIGGNLILILNNIVDTIQENHKAKSSARTLTLQSRYSGNIIAAMPVIIMLIMFCTMDISIGQFFQSKIGNIFLIFGCLLEIAGILVIKKILKFK